jgi:RNA polymerase sigma factor (sigma-70 family)
MGVCLRVLGNLHDAEDAFQAAVLVLVRKAPIIQPRELVGHWLYQVAFRTAMKAKTMKAKRRLRERAMSKAEVQTPEERLWQELVPLLDHELNRLPEKYRVPVVLRDLEGKSRKEVAGKLGLPEGTLSSRLAMARKILAQRLSRRGLMIAEGALAAMVAQKARSALTGPALIVSTVRAASLFTAGEGMAAGTIPAHVVALTQGVLKAMFIGKLKIATAAILGASIISITSITLSYHVLAAAKPSPQRAERSPKLADEKPKRTVQSWPQVAEEAPKTQDDLKKNSKI